MDSPIRVLIVEDSEDDAELVEHELRRAGFSPVCRRVETAEEMRGALEQEPPWEIVISDHSMPHFSAPAALETLNESGQDIPLIIVSGSIGEEHAVQAMRSGASDFVLKQSLTRLPAAVRRELADARERGARREAERLLRDAEERFRLLVQQIPGLTYEASLGDRRRTIFVSSQIDSLSGFSQEEWSSDPDFWSRRIFPDDRARVEAELRACVAGGSSFSSSYRILDREERVRWWHDGARVLPGPEPGTAILRGVVVDVTEEMQAEETIRHLAYHDRLTGLPNRTYLEHLLQDRLEEGGKRHSTVAVVALGLLRLTNVTCTLGTRGGEKLVAEVARKLQGALPSPSILGRLGQDRFAVLLPGSGAQDAVETAARSVAAASHPIVIEEIPIEMECAAGAAVSPGHGEEATALLQHAEIALDIASRGGLGVTLYDPAADPYSRARLGLLGDLRKGLESHQLHLEYQPKIDVARGLVSGFEALVRWCHPVRGLVPTLELLEAVEPTGLMMPLTLWILNEALRTCRTWLLDGIQLPVAVNLSARNLDRRDLPAVVQGLLSTWGLDPGMVELEVTESAILANTTCTQETLEGLHALGIALTIDDFGTGYSSLRHLRTIPVSSIKIDRSFVMGMASSKDDEVIVRSSIELAHNLGLRVVAEGVEDKRTLGMLAALHCDEAQGYYLGRPMAASALREWLSSSPYALKTATRSSSPGVMVERARVT